MCFVHDSKRNSESKPLQIANFLCQSDDFRLNINKLVVKIGTY